MSKKSLIAGIILTIINLVPTLLCAYLNAGIVYGGGEGAIGLIVIVPYSLILLPVIAVLLLISMIFIIKALKSESRKIAITARIFLIINIIIIIAAVVMIGRIIPLFLQS